MPESLCPSLEPGFFRKDRPVSGQTRRGGRQSRSGSRQNRSVIRQNRSAIHQMHPPGARLGASFVGAGQLLVRSGARISRTAPGGARTGTEAKKKGRQGKKVLTLFEQLPNLAPMDDTKRNVIAMFKTVRTYMNDNAAVWNALPAAVVAVNDLSTGIENLNTAVQEQEDPTEGITLDKAALRDALEDRIREVGDAVYACASATGSNSLAAQVAVTPSELDTMSEQRVDDVATRVFDAGTANLANLADYNVTQVKLDALDQARQDFQDAKSKPRAKISEKAGLTATLPQMIRDVKSILRTRLDKLMTTFRLSNPPFFAGYQSARVVVDLQGPGSDEPTPPTP